MQRTIDWSDLKNIISCSVCGEIPSDAIGLRCCVECKTSPSQFCHNCFTDKIKNYQKCKSHLISFTSHPPNQHLNKIIAKIKCKCPNYDDCGYLVPYTTSSEELKQHIDRCTQPQHSNEESKQHIKQQSTPYNSNTLSEPKCYYCTSPFDSEEECYHCSMSNLTHRHCETCCHNNSAASFMGDTTVFVKTLTGKTLTINPNLSEDVGVTKWRIYNTGGVPVNQQRLIFAGAQLDRGTLLSHNIQRESTLHLITQLRGS